MAKLKPNQFTLDGNILAEIPLLFSTEMVQANMEDRKTMTRRTRGLKEVNENPDKYNCEFFNEYGSMEVWKDGKVKAVIKSPYGKPGDLLWVREAWNCDRIDSVTGSEFYIPTGINCCFVYKAENPTGKNKSVPKDWKMKWKPSIHMPKAAARLWLMVEEIRVERVQDISEADSVAEGVLRESSLAFNQYLNYENFIFQIDTAKESFQSLWISINGPQSWNQNPWVWVVKYRILSKTGRPSEKVILENWNEVNYSI